MMNSYSLQCSSLYTWHLTDMALLSLFSKGYFVEPTIIQTINPLDKIMQEEIFGPVLAVFVYEEKNIDETLRLVKNHPYALTGSIFAQDK